MENLYERQCDIPDHRVQMQTRKSSFLLILQASR